MAVDLTTVSAKDAQGKYVPVKATIKITTIEKRERIWFVGIEGEAKRKLKCFPKQAQAFAVALEEGAEAEAEISVEEEEYNGSTSIVGYLRSFGGANKKSAGGGGGFGGAKAWQPKSPDEIFANPVSAMTIESFRLHARDGVCDHGAALATAKCMFEAYSHGLRIVGESRPQPKPAEAKAEAVAEPTPAADPEAEKRAERAAFAKTIFKDQAEVAAFKAKCAQAGREYADVMDGARSEGVTTCEQLEEFLAGAQKKAPGKRNEEASDGGWS